MEDQVSLLIGFSLRPKGQQYRSIRTTVRDASGMRCWKTSQHVLDVVVFVHSSLGARTLGAHTLGARTLGAHTLGARTLGAWTLGVRRLPGEDHTYWGYVKSPPTGGT
ncbi:hypothetical protein NHX12_014782 [Muraenolepis orangiensis]|uniref:Uncharacterized protein n=1 Tax=Muraenolepis orangiensis TaxID=630683 RepID=A0A9Q0D9G9_9TELE|nr:hypothetical protein NHX12_014782 [Muraenolepis orangiensis]